MINPWNDIKQPDKNISALRIDPDHPLDLFWAKDYSGHYLFVFEYSFLLNITKKDLPDLEGIDTVTIQVDQNISRLVLILLDKANWELFYALCIDLKNATSGVKDHEKGVAIILQRLARWQQFLKKKYPGILPEEKIKGLLGELLFIKNYLSASFKIDDIINFWIGPEGSPQDFNINDSSVEIKCQLGGTNPSVKISSAEQLKSQLSELFLVVFTLGKTTLENPNGINLPKIIESITPLITTESAQFRFQDLLLEVRGIVFRPWGIGIRSKISRCDYNNKR